MHARSALFDLYGDHLRGRGGAAPVAALVRLLAPLGIAAPAVRTAVSRMVRQGWLEPVRLDGAAGPAAGYALTPRAVRRLDDAAARIYRTTEPGWDDCWHLVHTTHVRQRATRDRLRSGMAFLGYAALDETTWIAPRASAEVHALLVSEDVAGESFRARHDGDSRRLVAQAWDLDALAAAYDDWLARAHRVVHAAGDDPDDETAFATRSALVHEWRLFLFRDPRLPRRLLPASWPADAAAAYFDRESARLLPASRRFVTASLDATAEGARTEPPATDGVRTGRMSALGGTAHPDEEAPAV